MHSPVLLKRGSAISAIGATCTHQRGPLEEGTLKGGEIIECPWHGSCFHLRDGSVASGPAEFMAGEWFDGFGPGST